MGLVEIVLGPVSNLASYFPLVCILASHILQKKMLVGLYEHNNFALLQQWGKIGDFFQQGTRLTLFIYSEVSSLSLGLQHK